MVCNFIDEKNEILTKDEDSIGLQKETLEDYRTLNYSENVSKK